jgi:hypothetical protein
MNFECILIAMLLWVFIIVICFAVHLWVSEWVDDKIRERLDKRNYVIRDSFLIENMQSRLRTLEDNLNAKK